MLLKSFYCDKLNIEVFDSRKNMGEKVARDFADCVKKMLQSKKELNVIFAAAPSQLDFLSSLKFQSDIEWNKINVFHMDEYVGISISNSQSFAGFVKKYVADQFPVKSFFPLKGDATDINSECERYTKLLIDNKPDIVCLGIGENCHIAFNDPDEADFWDEKYVKTVSLDEVCRTQQVNDKCFNSLNDVPKHAMTLTIPTLLRAKNLFCIVPAKTKKYAVKNMISKEISSQYPASALRIHDSATLYCDSDSGELIL